MQNLAKPWTTAFLLMITGLSLFAAPPATLPQKTGSTVIQFQGIQPSDPHGREGLPNPERGLRIETLIGEPQNANVWGPAQHLKGKVPPGYTDQWWILDAKRYAHHGLTLAQTYCYLDMFMDQPLSEEKLALLKTSLDQLRNHGLKAVLRFAYEKETNRRGGPTLETILGHLDQLAPIIQANADVIFVMQAGFVGAWGEWHSSAKNLEKDHRALTRITAKVLEVLPASRMTQVRVPKYKRWVLTQNILGPFEKVTASTAYSSKPAARIGFNNDGFLAGKTCGGTWTEPPHFSNPGNPEFDYMTEESPFVPVDGELFWADQGGEIDGLRAAVRMRLHHYASFSLAHSYSEREGKSYSIDNWMKTPVTLAQVQEAKLPISDGYFEDSKANEASRTQFEYIRDHLGYRIELQQARFPHTSKLGTAMSVEIALINRGFSAMHNPRPIYFTLIDDQERVKAYAVKDNDPRRWQPYAPGDTNFRPLTHTTSVSIPADPTLKPGRYLLGLWLPDADKRLRKDARYAVRVANRNVRWWTDSQGNYGINILGRIQVEK